MRERYDVIIVGGAAMGSAVAWFLTEAASFDGTICVLERDPGFACASTTHTNSCLRQQFSTAINIRLSRFTADYIRDFPARTGGIGPEIATRFFGYLHLAADAKAAHRLRRDNRVQRACGAATRLLSAAQVAEAWPGIAADDTVLAAHNPVDEGWFDGAAMVEAWRRFGRRRGVALRTGTVTGLTKQGRRVTGVRLADGSEVDGGVVVNCAGPRAAEVAAMAGIDLPVRPRKRWTWVFDAARPLAHDLPLTVDPSGVHVRSDGAGYMAGSADPAADPDVAPDDFTDIPDLFERHVWPILAARVPAFEALRVRSAWVGHYAMNTLDRNAILGPHADAPGLLLAAGFSGHGLQHAPGVGRGLAEWITDGAWTSLDLSPLMVDRLADGGLPECAVI